jgi:PAS domain S-box-containing protein
VRVLGTDLDITERRQAERALKESEERLRTLADAVPQIIWTNDAFGVADYFNQRWFEYSGLSLEDSLVGGWQAIVHPEDGPASKERWLTAQAKGQIFETEYRLRRADGQYRWFIGRNVPVRDAEGHVTSWFGTATGRPGDEGSGGGAHLERGALSAICGKLGRRALDRQRRRPAAGIRQPRL